jgi:hypothetical protein
MAGGGERIDAVSIIAVPSRPFVGEKPLLRLPRSPQSIGRLAALVSRPLETTVTIDVLSNHLITLLS